VTGMTYHFRFWQPTFASLGELLPTDSGLKKLALELFMWGVCSTYVFPLPSPPRSRSFHGYGVCPKHVWS
jgi:hypothetical protein